MKQSKKKVLSTFFALGMLSTTTISIQNNMIMSVNAADLFDNGIQDGYDWELYNHDNIGTAKMDLNGNGAFTAEWNDIESYHCKTGKIRFESIIDYNENITIEYDVDFRPNGNAYLAGYGWTDTNSNGKRIEYFIVENYGTWRPTGNNNDRVGSIEVDGHIYDVYIYTYFVDRGIDGGGYYVEQYYSVRCDEDKSSKGIINVTKHFEEWEKLGLDLGEHLKEVSLMINGYRSSGYAEIKKNDIIINGIPINNENDIISTEEISLNTPQITLPGDVNCDRNVDIADAVLVKCYLINAKNYSLSKQGAANADIHGELNGINIQDVVAIQKYVLKAL